MNTMANVKVHLRTRRGNVNIIIGCRGFMHWIISRHEKELASFINMLDSNLT